MEKSIDRLSALSNDILCHILSFLPTRFSVATSILARRWRFLWAYVPNLDFDTNDFDNDEFQVENPDTRFPDFIHRVLFLHKAKSLNTFRLACADGWGDLACNDYQLETWITIAIQRNVRNLDLRLTLIVPRFLFTCKTLVHLGLYNCVLGIPFTAAVSLPNLKKLHLFYVFYQFIESLPHLLSGCPLLEELIIEGEENLGCCNISSPTIKRLTLNFPFSYEFYRDGSSVTINTPALRYLRIKDFLYEHVSLSPMTALVEADISIINIKVERDYFDFEDYNTLNSSSVVKFLDCLRNVKCLKISGCYEKEFLDINVASSVLKFDNLTKLEVVADWRFLIKFLEGVDNLEVLIIHEVDAHLKYWKEPEQEPTCLSSHLRTIRIVELGYTEDEFNMVRYFLKHAKVLKRMEIYSQCDALQRISLFERGSEACELAFY